MFAARRLLRHMPADWPKPRTTAEIIWTVEELARTPRKFGTILIPAETRAIAFVHGLHRKSGLVPVKPEHMTGGLADFADEYDKLVLAAEESGQGT